MSRFFVGITGASGHAYSAALLRALVAAGHDVDVALTESGCKVLRHELGIAALPAWLGADAARHVRVFGEGEIEAPPSSGTALSGGVVLCPCSMGTLARVAAGFSSNLIERAADVALKEGRRLVVVPREAPLSVLHLENMLRLARLGARVLPASPGFYHRPQSVDDLVAHVTGKVLDALGVEHALSRRWSGLDAPPPERGLEGATRPPVGDDS